ncbi:hypothetical protein CONPUDRAFT_138343 [Coniophora puteana RWD-64-598 SS2]|uniref:DUF6533 domain-containing protein n=1 Tax=Coniophora puteana (strain RWD-64-598) TaxID=741705 RepID=A0A5M3MJF9_CONPW|nr:uncharacterized protein CONPUDRAFT_138343 [Coniophora puteana RWD-64-598 SS2]EIW79186.1 hypothetical protein CONPUDRAFT_138343 [Coniophora puteana RWD-64-598 SS2]
MSGPPIIVWYPLLHHSSHIFPVPRLSSAPIPSDRLQPTHLLPLGAFMSSLSDVGDTRQIIYWIMAALIAMVAEYVYMLPTEARYVWPKVFTKQVHRLKVYMLVRYTGMLAQGFNLYISTRMVAGTHTSPGTCQALYWYQAVSLGVVNVTAIVLVMNRNSVYYLFNKENFVSWCFLIIGAISAASMGVSARISFPHARLSKSCLIEEAHPGALVYMATNLTIIIILQSFSVWRLVRNPYGDDELARILRRDVNICGAALGVVMILMILCCTGAIRSVQVTNAGHSWLFFILWWMSGRLELHVQRYLGKRLQAQGGQEQPQELDTVIEFEDDESMFSRSRPSSVAVSHRASSTEATDPESACPSPTVAVPPKAVLRLDMS